jgi:hypothetical protein
LRDHNKYAEYQREYQRKYRQRKREEKRLEELEEIESSAVKVDIDDPVTYKLMQRMRQPKTKRGYRELHSMIDDVGS